MNYEVGLSRRWIFTILFWYGESLESPRHSVGYSTVGERLMAFHKRCVSSACFYSYSWKFLARRSINPSIRDLFFFSFFLFFSRTQCSYLSLFFVANRCIEVLRVQLYTMTDSELETFLSIDR